MQRNLLPLARSSFTSGLFWGEQPPLTPVGCGGRSLFDLELHYGIEPTVRLLTLLRGARPWGDEEQFLIWLAVRALRQLMAVTTAGAVAGVAATKFDCDAALGIFFRFQIPNFYLFIGLFSLCHFIFPFPISGLPR